MKQKVKNVFIALSFLLFIGLSVFVFTGGLSPILLFPFFLIPIFSVGWLGQPAMGFILTGLFSMLGFFVLSGGSKVSSVEAALWLFSAWVGNTLLYFHSQKGADLEVKKNQRIDEILKQSRILKQEVSFYEQRKAGLLKRAEQRRRLSRVARELGSLLDPAQIQEKLVDTAKVIFPQAPVQISIGQQPDPIDQYILQRKQPVLVPSSNFKGDPLLAVPISSQGAVAGILRVGGIAGPEYSRDDLRLLEILASFASLALDNSLLFQQVQENALRDGLTGLWTIRAFNEQLEAEILQASRFNQPLSVILSDVDHFKSINDTYGHQAGDQVLQGFAHVLARNVRDVDFVARYGGEEFIVLLPQTTNDEAREVAEKIRIDLEDQRFDVGGKIISITSSFGVSTFPDDATSAQQLVRAADQRMYSAKKKGRNQVIGRAA